MSKFLIFILEVLFVLTNKWHLSALIFIKLSLNHLNKIYEASSKDWITPSVLENSLLSNINDNGSNNEKKLKNKKTRMGIFKNMSGNIQSATSFN